MTKERPTGATRRDTLALMGGAAAALASAGSATAQLSFPQGAVIRTILRDYRPEELAGGATLFHEHMSQPPDFMPKWNAEAQKSRNINAGTARGPATPPARAGRAGAPPAAAPANPNAKFYMQDIDLMVDEISTAKKEGIACLVDGGHPDMGRDIQFLKTLSQRSGMPIVAGGGYYNQPFYPAEISKWSEQQIFDALMKQVRTDPLGAWGEIGSWDYITKDERKMFRAIGRAQVATAMPVFTHTGIPGKSALEQLDLLEDAGADLKKVCIGHLGNLNDENVEIHKAVCRRGAFVGFDRQGGAGDGPVATMAMKLIDAGYADNLLFSSDFSGAGALKKNGGAGYAKTLTVFVPKVKALGATDAVLRQIMNDNPRRFLTYVPKIKRAW